MDTSQQNSTESNCVGLVNLKVLREKFEKANQELKLLTDQVSKKKTEVQIIRDIHNAYLGLETTKTERDPGKYNPAYFLDNSCRECPGCKTNLPVIRCYYQTVDSPCGDEWVKLWNIYCPACLIITKVREPDYRDGRS